ncbi:hypothetical protein EON64_17480 [archaeon]|nr:MAG: hypothetical protein EON64_17480 [archaeon]
MFEMFKAPPTSASYEVVLEHLDENLKTETPLAFGLHPNAEIGFRTHTSEELLRSVLELSANSLLTSSPTEGASEGEGRDAQAVAEALIQDILEQTRDVKFDLEAVAASMDDVGPFQNVVLQECERMNILIQEIVRSLIELDLGFKGDLTVSDQMEELAYSLYMDRVPKAWASLAYPSMRALGAWLVDLQNRISQLGEWSSSPQEVPTVTWLPGLFNPQSFLTAIMQITAQAQNLELDKLSLVTDLTKKLNAEDFTSAAKEGAYIHGLFLEGGSFNLNQGVLESARPREMFSALPVINIRPVIMDRIESGVFSCPVYKTQQRGPTYVFSMQLRSKYDPGKWVLAGVVAIMEVL